MTTDSGSQILVTGGAGYVGAVLVPKLLARGHRVRILDLFLYGEDAVRSIASHPALELMNGDIRDPGAVQKAVSGCDAVIHLACISNDPSFELDPQLGRSINFDAFEPLIRASRDAGVRRFIYASSSSVYGLKSDPDVTEELMLEPLTDYSRYKALCEEIALAYNSRDHVVVVLRPATVCGPSPRLRLDLTVNLLTAHAIANGRIRVFGGSQKRPNIHILDMAAAYVHVLGCADDRVGGEIFNVGYENYTVLQIAEMVRSVLGDSELRIDVVPTDDLRSYHISSEKIRRVLGFTPTHTVEQAIAGLVKAFRGGAVPNAMTDPRYYNIKTMQLAGMR